MMIRGEKAHGLQDRFFKPKSDPKSCMFPPQLSIITALITKELHNPVEVTNKPNREIRETPLYRRCLE